MSFPAEIKSYSVLSLSIKPRLNQRRGFSILGWDLWWFCGAAKDFSSERSRRREPRQLVTIFQLTLSSFFSSFPSPFIRSLPRFVFVSLNFSVGFPSLDNRLLVISLFFIFFLLISQSKLDLRRCLKLTCLFWLLKQFILLVATSNLVM